MVGVRAGSGAAVVVVVVAVEVADVMVTVQKGFDASERGEGGSKE